MILKIVIRNYLLNVKFLTVLVGPAKEECYIIWRSHEGGTETSKGSKG
jgi:hypothetical protein